MYMHMPKIIKLYPLNMWNLLHLNDFFFKVSSMSNMGPELTTLRSRLVCSTQWANQKPLNYISMKLLKNIFQSICDEMFRDKKIN